MNHYLRWAPPTLLAAGAILTVGIDLQRTMPLREPLAAAVPRVIAGLTSLDRPLSEAELAIAAPSAYLNRVYQSTTGDTAVSFGLYVGYYGHQTQGKAIHSPKNCLPGSGWEPLSSEPAEVPTHLGVQTVNRYWLQSREERVLVLYWYQGRGRVEGNEYRVKWDLLRDAALRRRSEEALVRIVVPARRDADSVSALATRVAALVIPALEAALPP
jgi:EpsI family protein